MHRILSVVPLFLLLALCVSTTASCGGAAIAEAAPAASAAVSVRHEFTLVQKGGTERTMEVYGWSHEVVSPRDAASGLPTGKRQHKPFTVIKAVDKSTPIIMNALVTNEVLEVGTLTSYRMVSGTEEVYRTIMITMPFVCTRAAGGDTEDGSGVHEDREHVSFCYQKITTTWSDGGITAEDDWETSR